MYYDYDYDCAVIYNNNIIIVVTGVKDVNMAIKTRCKYDIIQAKQELLNAAK